MVDCAKINPNAPQALQWHHTPHCWTYIWRCGWAVLRSINWELDKLKSSVPSIYGCNFRYVICRIISLIYFFNTWWWVPQHPLMITVHIDLGWWLGGCLMAPGLCNWPLPFAGPHGFAFPQMTADWGVAFCLDGTKPLPWTCVYQIPYIIWVRSRRWGCLVTWFCYQMIAKPGNKTAALLWPDRAHIDGLVQERHNSSALAMELRLSCINPSICHHQGPMSWTCS